MIILKNAPDPQNSVNSNKAKKKMEKERIVGVGRFKLGGHGASCRTVQRCFGVRGLLTLSLKGGCRPHEYVCENVVQSPLIHL